MTSSSTILITGAGGMLASYLAKIANQKGNYFLTGRRSGDLECDLTDESSTHRLLSKVNPTIIFHTAALTDVDKCQKFPDEADRSNRVTTLNLVSNLPKECKFIYFSTDQVYPDKEGPHKEGDEDPVNVYGKTKLLGEYEALSASDALVLRANFFGPSLIRQRKSLSDFIIDNLRNQNPITLFKDVLFSPLHMITLANCAFDMIEMGIIGTYNIGSREGMTKSQFGLAVAEKMDLSTDTVSIGESNQIAGRAPRARDLRMDLTLIERALGQSMPLLSEEIRRL